MDVTLSRRATGSESRHWCSLSHESTVSTGAATTRCSLGTLGGRLEITPRSRPNCGRNENLRSGCPTMSRPALSRAKAPDPFPRVNSSVLPPKSTLSVFRRSRRLKEVPPCLEQRPRRNRSRILDDIVAAEGFKVTNADALHHQVLLGMLRRGL